MGRFSSSLPIKGRIRTPERGLIWGPPGVGKSETLAQIPGAVFIDLHGSTSKVDVIRVCNPWSNGDDRPPATFEETRELVKDLGDNPNFANTPAFVFEGADDINKQIERSAAQDHNAASLDAVQWKAGYPTVIAKWQEFLNQDLTQLQAKTKAAIWFTSNDKTHQVPNPDGPEFLAYAPNVFMRVSEKNYFNAAQEICRWCDTVLYLSIEDSVRRGGFTQSDNGLAQIDNNKIEKEKFAKASSAGRRACYTRYCGWVAYAKNRIGLPSVIYANSAAALWGEYAGRVEKFHTTDPRILKGIIAELLKIPRPQGVNFDDKRFAELLTSAADDPEALRKLVTGLESKFVRG